MEMLKSIKKCMKTNACAELDRSSGWEQGGELELSLGLVWQVCYV